MTHDLQDRAPAGLETLPGPAQASADPAFRARFTRGSVLRHVLVMTATGTVGTLSIFAVDLLSLVYVSHLGSTELKAAAGFATQVLVYPVAVNIGLTIAVTAAVSKALGADHRARAKRIASSGLAIAGVLSAVVALAALAGAGSLLALFGAQGHTRDVAERFLMIALPGNVPFAAVFALTGAVGPILGQNLGARLYGRVSATLTRCFAVTLGYGLAVWLALALLWPEIAAAFQASPAMTTYLRFFCTWGVVAWPFIGMLFVANAAFNNLGFPLLSMVFNWGRATLGTVPFVTLGAHLGGVQGGMMGVAAGAALFGTGAMATAYRVVGRLEARTAERGKPHRR